MSQMIALNVGALHSADLCCGFPAFVRPAVSGQSSTSPRSSPFTPKNSQRRVRRARRRFLSLAFSRSLNQELADKGVRVQVVLPRRETAHRLLGHRRHAGRGPSCRVGHAGWRDGRCGTGGT